MIKTQIELNLNRDEALVDFILHPNYCKSESDWVGTSTVYQNCFHLLPNFFLDLKKGEPERFSSGKVAARESKETIIPFASKLLRNIINATVDRYNHRFALTAGLDSRVLLAASKDNSKEISYYMDRMGILPLKHPDVTIPKRLAKKFKLSLTIKNSFDNPPGWFVSLLSKNVTNARILPKTRSIYSKYLENEDFININGNVSELCKKSYKKKFMRNENKACDVSSEDLIRLFGYKNLPTFLVNELTNWRNQLNLCEGNIYDIFDLFYGNTN